VEVTIGYKWEEDKEALGEETVLQLGSEGLRFRSAGEGWGFSAGGLWYGFDQSGVPTMCRSVCVGGVKNGTQTMEVEGIYIFDRL